MAEPIPGGDTSDVAKREEAVLAFWREKRIFEKTLEKKAPKGEFVFYDGPPFATGTPHSGSLLSSVSKDVIPRYKTMRGYRVRRRWGWDTHGLPIESLVEKKLGLKNKKEILSIGIEKFNETARSMVLEYVSEWKRYVERVGRFVDFDHSYKTMDPTYTESVWWALKEIHKKGNLYEGRKVLLYCPHCETPLAKAEIAMDNTYQDVTEEAVTAKFKIKNPEQHELPANTFIIAWTTTPWTLPGNVALAVGAHIEYVLFRSGDEHLIGAKELLPEHEPNTLRTFRGEELVGIEYEPLYAIPKVAAHQGKKWLVLPADFVSTGEGTGVVHTAVIYGEDDYNLGVAEKLPMVPLLNPNGTYNDDAPEFLRGEYIKKAEKEIKDDLEARGLLFKKAAHTHSYPHCYRCGTPLIYNAVSSWFINMQSVKKTMLAENEKITWVPAHLKHGRFQNIVENAPDWTISRNRFWASPLPIWKDMEGNVVVVGSLEELKALTKKSGNRYFVLRHGESEGNVLGLMSTDPERYGLTEKGRSGVLETAKRLPKPGVIYASPFKRTRESAEIAAKALGYPKEKIVYDERLREYDLGDFTGKSMASWLEYREGLAFDAPAPGGESYQDAKRRFGDFIYEIEKKHQNETVLIVTHGIGLESLSVVTAGLDKEASRDLIWHGDFKPAGFIELDFVPLPHNRDYELDYHLPYIDAVELVNEKGDALTRIPEVVDCWVESGAMPFAEYHFPFAHRAEFESRSPGDFVSEYIGQTRAWFYYMHALSVHLFGRQAFRNVVTTGTILAADGEKLSKSKKNYTDPYVLFDRFGADAFRYYLMSSVVMQAEDLTFRDEDVKEIYGRVVNILRNTHSFYLLYADRAAKQVSSPHVLDRWILKRLEGLSQEMTEAYDRYDSIRATRPIREFVEDFSTWHVRRSRERVKGEDAEDARRALSTMREVFHTLSRLIAPVMPFVAEELFQSVRDENDPESVHLAEWPVSPTFLSSLTALFRSRKPDSLLVDMAETRRLVSLGLEARQKENIKVRQPLGSLIIPSALGSEFLALIKDEVNVKEIIRDPELAKDEVKLDTHITEELKREGELRDLLREVQDLRKKAGMEPKEKAVLRVPSGEAVRVSAHWQELSRAANLSGREEGEHLDVRKA